MSFINKESKGKESQGFHKALIRKIDVIGIACSNLETGNVYLKSFETEPTISEIYERRTRRDSPEHGHGMRTIKPPTLNNAFSSTFPDP